MLAAGDTIDGPIDNSFKGDHIISVDETTYKYRIYCCLVSFLFGADIDEISMKPLNMVPQKKSLCETQNDSNNGRFVFDTR